MPDTPQTEPGNEQRGVMAEYGVTGLRQQAGYVMEEFLPALRPTSKAMQVYREMRDNSSVVGAVLYAIEMLLRGVEWSVDPCDADPDKAEFVEQCMGDMSMTFEDVVSEILSMLPFGFSYHEIVYKVRKGDSMDNGERSKYDDGLYGWRKLPIRAQESLQKWEFDPGGGLQGMWQWDPRTYSLYFIPIESALMFRTSMHKGNPEGKSILRNAYRSWWYCKRIEEHEAVGIERDVAGIPMAGIPPELFTSTNPEERAAYEQYKKLVTNLRNDEQTGILYPLSYDENGNERVKIELLSSPGSKLFDTDKVIMRYRVDIAVAALSDVILLGHDKVGTQSLAITKEDLFVRGLEAQLDMIAAVFNSYAIPRLFRVNGWPTDNLPEIRHGELQNVDLKDFAEIILRLAQAGMALFPNPEIEAEIYQLLDLPVPEVPPIQATGLEEYVPEAPARPVTRPVAGTPADTRGAGASDAGATPPEMASQMRDATNGQAR